MKQPSAASCEDHNRLVLLHGWGFDHRVWDGMAAALQAHYQVERPDLRMPDVKDNAISRQGSDGCKTLLAISLKEPCVLVGWSLGGLLAIRLAKQFPATVRAVVLLASTPCFFKRPDWPYGIEPHLLSGLINRIDRDAGAAMTFFCGLVASGDPSPRHTMKILRAQVVNNDKESLLHGLHVLAREDLRTDLAAITCPLALILGSNDKLVDPAIAHEINKLRADVHQVIMNNAGHAPFVLQQEETVLHIQEFLHECVK